MPDESTPQVIAKAAKSQATAPDYDEQAIAEALWAVVAAVLAGSPDEA